MPGSALELGLAWNLRRTPLAVPRSGVDSRAWRKPPATPAPCCCRAGKEDLRRMVNEAHAPRAKDINVGVLGRRGGWQGVGGLGAFGVWAAPPLVRPPAAALLPSAVRGGRPVHTCAPPEVFCGTHVRLASEARPEIRPPAHTLLQELHALQKTTKTKEGG